ncbi:hypothetical protein LV469_03060 [Peptoniphilus sp. GNH]|nr:hypothetical protein LV469_03060 [Peptoniphilus sp. GNH]
MKLVSRDGRVILNFRAPFWRFLKRVCNFIFEMAVLLMFLYMCCEPI